MADAVLVWLKVYSFDELISLSSAELLKSVKAVWADIKALSGPIAVQVVGPGPVALLRQLVADEGHMQAA